MTKVTRGVWRVADSEPDLATRCAAVLAALPPRTVVAGPTAGVLHGLWLPAWEDGRLEMILHDPTVLPRHLPHSIRSEIRARRREIAPDEIAVVAGVPVTTPARTWCDLAETLAPAALVAAGDSVLRTGATVDEMLALVDRGRHRRGVVRARQAVPLLDGRARSRPESHLRYAVVSAGLPTPAVNAPIYGRDGEWLAEPDLHYASARLALEYQGAQHADPTRMRRDISRELDIDRAGWRILQFGPREVFGRPEQVASLVRALLIERDPSFGQRRQRVG